MLKTKHIFPFAKMIKKMDIKEDLKELLSELSKPNEDNKPSATGLNLVMLIIENIPDAEEEFYIFVSSVNGMSVEEIKELGINELVEILKSILVDINFASFFKVAVT